MSVFKVCENSLCWVYTYNLYIFLEVYFLKIEYLKILCMSYQHNCKSCRVHGTAVCPLYLGPGFWLNRAGVLPVHLCYCSRLCPLPVCSPLPPPFRHSVFQSAVGCASVAVMICIAHLNHKLTHILLTLYKYRSYFFNVLPWLQNTGLYRCIQNDKKKKKGRDKVALIIKIIKYFVSNRSLFCT